MDHCTINHRKLIINLSSITMDHLLLFTFLGLCVFLLSCWVHFLHRLVGPNELMDRFVRIFEFGYYPIVIVITTIRIVCVAIELAS